MSGSDEAKKGADALADLFETEYGRIVRYVYVRIGDAGAAEELASDVFLRALEGIDAFEWRGVPMQAWLFRIARNLVVDYLRKHARRKLAPLDAAAEVASPDSPEEDALQTMERAEMLEAMEYLTAAQREVVSLRFFAGLSSQETAQVVKRSNGAVRELQSAALKTLRHVLAAKQGRTVQAKGGG
ncbi:MAG: sigma-70 family RNA polymerase sigma factor [Chloroflexi bacterium]|nr:sigma-70 family RNA polymerase sigma factor [Chloroflexota bacterium]